ncbi:MAG: MalY/PatB family protein [Clostridium sp.]|uniref:MalY/PatB family protein n=1 Tax=Clostridium sp. TaxID=1506 RepID=UPI003EE70BE2
MNKFDILKERKNTNSIKWDFINFMYPDLNHEVLPLWVADMDFECCDSIVNSLKERAESKIYGYSSFDDEYYNIIIKWVNKKYGYSISKNEIFYSPGIVPALGILIRALTKEKDGIIIQSPVYYPFKNMIINNHRTVVENNLINKNGYYEIDFDDLEEKAKNPNNKMLILCSPHNPVGRVWSSKEIEKIANICIKYNIYLISDEIHCDLIREGISFTSMGKFKELLKNQLVVCTAPSKSFNLAGLNLSNVFIFNESIKELWKNEITNKMAVSNPTPFAISATKAAYTKGDEWLKEVNKYIDNNLIYLKEFLDKKLPNVKYLIPEGTYLAWLDFNSYDLTDEELTNIFLNEAKVAFDEGKLFGKTGEKFQRINVACPRVILKEALEKIYEALKSR